MKANQNYIVEPNKKVSSVDYLISQLQISTYWKYLIMEVELMECGEIDILEQAKAMHKDEIIKSWMATNNELQRISAEQYYNETFQ